MATYSDREAYIPFQRQQLIDLCLREEKLLEGDQKTFREFCDLLSAYYHFQFHQILEKLKTYYTLFNPHEDLSDFQAFTAAEKKQMESDFFAQLEQVLKRANYFPVSQKTIQEAFEQRSLIELKTDIDFNDFDQFLCYARGDVDQSVNVKRWFRKTPKKIDVFERVVVALKFKDEQYFLDQNKKNKPSKKLEKKNFLPGKIYLFFYKNIPKFDLEFIFPNVQVSMTWKDRLILTGSALGAGIPMAIKLLPKVILIVGIILFLTGSLSGLEGLNIKDEDVRNLTGILLATFSLLVTFGAFGFKQYNSYKNKKIKFQKSVTETLFFKNLATNATVFHALIDAAEEEECKEIILVYYHLLTSGNLMTPEELDNQIEGWMEQSWKTKIDFDIQGPLNNLSKIKGALKNGNGESQSDVPLLSYDQQGKCQVRSLAESLEIVDYLWDNAFRYH